MSKHLLSFLIFAPLGGAILFAFIPKRHEKFFRFFSLGLSVALLIPCFKVLAGFSQPYDGFLKFMENYAWIDSWGISYLVGVDGISVFMVLLTIIMTILALLSSGRAIDKRVKK